jgi:hypothetical protein
LRQHWAQILAGEIRNPGSFSLSTLQLFAVLDPDLAATIKTVRGWIADKNWILAIGDLGRGPKYTLLMQLDSVGFLRLGSSRGTTLNGTTLGRSFFRRQEFWCMATRIEL